MDDQLASRIFQNLAKMEEPDWANIKYENLIFRRLNITLLESKTKLANLDEVDPELLKTFRKVRNQYRRTKAFSWSCSRYCDGFGFCENHFPSDFERKGIIFCSISEAIKEYPELVQNISVKLFQEVTISMQL